jgi:4-amino-4-deoxy-L-arabinose transferase-like glycosyltransferase
VNSRFRVILTAALLGLATAALYIPRLDAAPRYLVTDELYSALTAHSVAATGRDPHGAFLPLYFQMDLPKQGRPMWFQPILVYAIAIALKVLPFSEATIRLPMAIAGVVNVVLIYLVSRQLFGRELFAIAAAGLLALTPAHFLYSRYAMDFQAPLPFLLGWLLCVALYLKRPAPRLLFAAGLLLGIGVYSYIAAAFFMPLYFLLTCVVLVMRRETLTRIGILAAGFALPLLLIIPALIRNPTLLRDVAVHYQPDAAPATTGAAESFATLIAPSQLAEAASLFGGFWNPRFLFIDGPLRFTEATWLVGVFLLALAGLLVVGIARTLRRPLTPVAFVLLAGFLTAPLPASFAGQGEAIRRALELLPFAVLIGVFGLEVFWGDRAHVARTVGFVAFWGVILALAVASHGHIPRAQAYVRAASAPLGLGALALAMERFSADQFSVDRLAVPAMLTLFLTQIAYFLGAGSFVPIVLAGVLVLAIFLRRESGADSRRLVIIVVLVALAASEFVFQYVDIPVRRVAGIPASAILLAVRFVVSGLIVAAAFAAARIANRAAGRIDAEAVGSIAVVVALCVQVAYFFVDFFANPVLRYMHVTAIVATAVGLAAWSKDDERTTSRLGPLTAVGLLGLAALQFGFFYSDYFTGFQARGSGTAVGNVRLALETAIDRAGNRPVPGLYLARVRNESPGLGNLFAKFYLIKKQREDLIDRTVEGDDYMGFEIDRVSALPPGSLVIVNPSSRNETNVDRLVASGDLVRHELLKTPDGTPMFWVLERTPR